MDEYEDYQLYPEYMNAEEMHEYEIFCRSFVGPFPDEIPL